MSDNTKQKQLTVSELIKLLQGYDPDLLVACDALDNAVYGASGVEYVESTNEVWIIVDDFK